MDIGKHPLWHILEELQSSNEDEDVYDNGFYTDDDGVSTANSIAEEKDGVKTYKLSDFTEERLHVCDIDDDSKNCICISDDPTAKKRPTKKIKYDHVQIELKISLHDVSNNLVPLKPEYQRGSLVWAKVRGYPLWPAMVDDDPDYNTFFWIDEETPPFQIQYHVVFFDADKRLSRFWCTAHQLKPFGAEIKISTINTASLMKRFEVSLKEARKAAMLSREKRLKKYAFILRMRKPDTKLCED